MALRGGFPEVAYSDRTERNPAVWLTSSLGDLVTRDAAGLDSAKDPAKLRRYLSVPALDNAGIPSDATLYRAAGVNARTAAAYDQLLTNFCVLAIVPAWASNRLNRLIRQGKRYMVDSGLTATAVGVSATAILEDVDLPGRWFDAFAAAQLRPELSLAQPRPMPHHLRLEAGRRQVDLLVELGARRVVAVEFKAGSVRRASSWQLVARAETAIRRPVNRVCVRGPRALRTVRGPGRSACRRRWRAGRG